MINKNLLGNLINFYLTTKNNFRNIYQKSNLYDKKISKVNNINFDNCKSAIDAGANILVSGTTIFKSNDGDIKKNINLLKLK